MLNADEARELLDTIDTSSLVGLRDQTLIGLIVFTFARVGATVGMRVEDYYVQGRRGWVRLHEKGGKRHEVPANHNLDTYLEAYIEGAGRAAAAGRRDVGRSVFRRQHDRQNPGGLFRVARVAPPCFGVTRKKAMQGKGRRNDDVSVGEVERIGISWQHP